MEKIVVNPVLRKAAFAQARGWSTRTLDRYVARRWVPRGEVLDGRGSQGWRASLVNLTLEELKALAQAQPDDGVDHEATTAQMREIGAKGGRRSREAA